MYDPAQAELISAYVDGQLDAAERALAERLLDQQPALRQLRDELLSYRHSLQSLPKVKPPIDLVDRVLQKAERQVLRGDSLARVLDAQRPASLSMARPAPLDDEHNSAWRRMVRPAVWASLAVAAALAISVLSREPQDSRTSTVALAPSERRDAGPAAPPPVMTKGGPDFEPASESPSMRAANRDEEVHQAESQGGATDSLAPVAPSVTSGEGSPATVGGRRMRVPAENLGATSSVERADAPAEAETAALPSDLVLFQCDVTPAALAENLLQQALVSQQIELVTKDAQDRDEASAQDDAGRPKLGFDKSAGVKAALAGESASPVHLVYVEATPAQLQAALEQIGRQPEQFVNISVVPPATPTEQPDWTVYNRQNAVPASQAGAQRADAEASLADHRRAGAADQASPTADAPRDSGKEAVAAGTEVDEVQDSDVQLYQAGQSLHAAVGRELSNYYAQQRGDTDQAAKNERRSQAEPIALPVGNAIEQTLNSPVYRRAQQILAGQQNLVSPQTPKSQLTQQAVKPGAAAQALGRDSQDGKLLEKKQAATQRPEPEAPTAGSIAPSPTAGDWRRVVFVLRLIDAPPAPSPPPGQ